MPKYKKGHIPSEKSRKKMSKSHMGMRPSKQTRIKMSKAAIKRFRNPENHPNWQGGITEENQKNRSQTRDWKKTNTQRRNSYALRRQKMLTKLRGRCVRCGFSDSRALQIDHIRGGGRRKVKRLGGNTSSAYFNSVMADDNNEYQLLCANCNQIKKHKNREVVTSVRETHWNWGGIKGRKKSR